MRRVLLSVITLAAASTAAHAQDVSLSGSAALGLFYDSDRPEGEVSTVGEVEFFIVGSGISDSGLEFGALIAIDEDTGNASGDGADNNGVSDAEVFLSGAFGTLRVGDLDPATDGFGIADLGFSGIGIDDVAEQYRNATAGADVSWSFSREGLSFVASAEIGDQSSVGLAAEYAAGPFNIGLGYVDDADAGNNTVSVTAGWSYGSVAINGLYSDWSSGGQGYGVDLSVDTGPATVTAAWAQARGAEADPDEGLGDAYGIGVAMPLSDGLTVSGGVGIIETDATPDGSRTVADFGVTMSF